MYGVGFRKIWCFLFFVNYVVLVYKFICLYKMLFLVVYF